MKKAKKKIAPDAGYNTSKKRHYRRRAWVYFKDNKDALGKMKREGFCMFGIKGFERLGGVMFMPSKSDAEIKLALSKRFKQDELHIVDHNPAIVAVHNRQYRDIHTYGCDIFDAIQRAHDDGFHLMGFHLDMMCGADQSFIENIYHAAAKRLFSNGALLIVNMLRGRERFPGWVATAKEFTDQVNSCPSMLAAGDRMEWREMALYGALVQAGYGIYRNFADTYKSAAGHQTMRYVAFGLYDLESYSRQELNQIIRFMRDNKFGFVHGGECGKKVKRKRRKILSGAAKYICDSDFLRPVAKVQERRL